MRLSDMARTVAEDLSHIPKGERGSPQQVFRAIYPMQRKRDLSENASTLRADSFARAVASVRRNVDPEFTPECDSEFFRETV